MAPRIVQVETAEQMEHVRALFREYGAVVEARACVVGMDAELGALPAPYSRPRGALLLAYDEGGEPVGCVAIRPLGDLTAHGLGSPADGVARAELKRLYVRPEARGRGLARALTLEGIDFARGAGYGAIRLDTLPTMREAIGLYTSLGFREIVSGVSCAPRALFFELALAPTLEIVDTTGTASPGAMGWLERYGALVMARLGSAKGASGSVRVRIIGDEEMRAMHARHSGDDSTTDVLTFDLREDATSTALDVDVLVCADEARRQGSARSHAPEAELLLYLLHACMHCLGHDDDTPEGSARMHAEEDEILKGVGLPSIYAAPPAH